MSFQNMQKTHSGFSIVACDWQEFSEQLLKQWQGITRDELEETHHDRCAIARLIERKEGISAQLVENYLINLERTLPLFH
jgi:hypothetical protein